MTDDIDADSTELRELKRLVGEGGWSPLLSSPPGMLVFIRPWPDGSVDSLAIRGEPEGSAERTNPDGHPVWRRKGAVSEVIAALREVPGPDSPDAPRSIISHDSPDRTF